jgi:hypothetical protein
MNYISYDLHRRNREYLEEMMNGVGIDTVDDKHVKINE